MYLLFDNHLLAFVNYSLFYLIAFLAITGLLEVID